MEENNNAWIVSSSGVSGEEIREISGTDERDIREIDKSELAGIITSINAENEANSDVIKEKEKQEEEERLRRIAEEKEAIRMEYFKERAEKEKVRKQKREEEKAREEAEANARKKEREERKAFTVSDEDDRLIRARERHLTKERNGGHLTSLINRFRKGGFLKKEDADRIEAEVLQESSGISDTESSGEQNPISEPSSPEYTVFEDPEEKPIEPIITEPRESVPITDEAMSWKWIATHDDMTGVGNRTAFDMILKAPDIDSCGVAYVDANNLKYINDTRGHKYGDKLILAIADVLDDIYGDGVYRIGGDEFVVILKGTPEAIRAKFESGFKSFHELLESRSKKNNIEGVVYSASVGYCIPDGRPFSELMTEADKAMYAKKEEYKKAHPLPAYKKIEDPETDPEDIPYDDRLSEEQKELKQRVKEYHEMPDRTAKGGVSDTENIMRDIQRQTRENNILAIIITDREFNKLFIFTNPASFIDLVVEKMDNFIDYSYLYAVTENGPRYYGGDEYMSEVTHIFEGIADLIKEDRLTDRTLQRVPQINTFKDIYLYRD